MAAMKRTILTLMLFASLAAAQIMPPVVTPPVTFTASPPAIKSPKAPKPPKAPKYPPSGFSPSTPGVVPSSTTGPIPPTMDTTTGGSSSSSSNNTMDTAISGCRNQYHVIVTDDAACTTRCNDKVLRSKVDATVDPQTYPSTTGAGTCCNCNFERTLGPGMYSPGPSAGNGTAPSSATLDPSTFKPPTAEQMVIAVDPTYTVAPGLGETNTYAVLRVTGGPFTTPLDFNYIVGFIYAFNNVTGVPWQYKGDAPSIPNEYPAAPNGLPQVRNGPPPAPPMAVPTVVSAPPTAPVPAAAPVDPAAASVAPTVDPAAVSPSTVPVDPAAALAAAPVAGAPVVPAARRLLRSSTTSSARHLAQNNRRLLQDTGNGQYSFSPMPGSSPASSDYNNNGDYSSPPNDYNSPSNDYGSPSPPSGDYNNGDYSSPSNSDYSPPSPPTGDYNSPSPSKGNSPSPNGDYGSPSPSIDSASPAFSSPPTMAPSPPPSPIIILSAPPAPPGEPLPANADGIWYFSMMPLTEAKFVAMATALNVATGNGTGSFLRYLTAAGVPATGVELRYMGQPTEGQIDLTKKLDGDLFGAASYASAPPSPDSGMSTATTAAIVGGVVGGVVLIAIAGVLVASNRRKSSKVQKQALTQRWKTERELVEAERVKLDAAATGAVYANGSTRTRSQNSAHDAGFVAMTSNDLDQQRSMRRAATMAAEAKLSSKQLGIEASPSMSARSGGNTPKPSRLDSMRSALGLNKSSSAIKKGGSTSAAVGATTPSSAAAAPGRSGSFAWTVEGNQGVSPLNPTRSLRSQFSTGAGAAAAPSPSRGDIEAPGGSSGAGDKPSPWGKMFSKK